MASSTPPCETLPGCLRRARRGRAAGIAAGYVADLLFGDPRRGHPVALFGSGAAALERLTYADTPRGGCAAHRRAARGARRAGRDRVERAAARRGPGGRPRLPRRRRSSRSAVRRWLARATDMAGLSGRRRRRRRPRDCCRRCAGATPRRSTSAGLTRAALESVAENTSDAAGGAAVVGRGRRGARAAGLPRRQHARRDDRPPLAAVRPVRLGRSTIR